jgi:low temperature requirement protein LtrA
MTGRNPGESHRAASPLELLFDLAFVAAFSQAGNQFAHAIADGHTREGVIGFAFAMFGICWAWINFTWFASAFDTDDWFYRVLTMIQMVGVVILALGLPEVFHSLEDGGHLDNRIVVAGYVVMRISMVLQWLRVAIQDPVHRRAALVFVVTITLAQIGWVVTAFVDFSVDQIILMAPLYLLELAGPVVAETRTGGTPWHPHHIAERYGLLTIIALGEGVFGTVASVSALVEEQGWSKEAVFVVVAGIGLTFGLWWNYFMLPSGEILARHRYRSFVWGYGHIPMFAAIAATGAGLHAAAYVIEGGAHIGIRGAIIAVAIPVLIFSVGLFAHYTYLVNEFDTFHVKLFSVKVLFLLLAVALAAAGASIGTCLLLITAAPAVTIVGYETIGHLHKGAAMERALS